MKIDRGRFLLLTSAISVGACPTPPKPPPPIAKVDPPASSDPPAITANAPPLWSRDSPWWAFPSDPENCLPGPSGWKPPLVCMPLVSGANCRSSSASPAAPKCAIDSKTGCHATLAATCEHARARLSPATAPRAIACLEEEMEGCGYGDGPEYAAGRCLAGAAMEACDDPNVADLCGKLVQTCKGDPLTWDDDRCRALFSGLSDSGRADVSRCMLESHCALGPAECLALR